jgi:hypothetical protein
MIHQPKYLLVSGNRVAVVDEHADTHAAVGGAQQMIGQRAAGLVASENVVLKIEGPLRGVDYLYSRPESVRADAEHAECGFAWMLMSGARELVAENSILWVTESH